MTYQIPSSFMTRLTYTCRNTLQRLRERSDERQRRELDTTKMQIARVEYTVMVTGEDEKTVSVNKERMLFGLDSCDLGRTQQMLEQGMPAADTPYVGLTSLAVLSI